MYYFQCLLMRLIFPKVLNKLDMTPLKKCTAHHYIEKNAPDFYYEECIDDPDTPPYITVHPDNKTFVSKNGSLYFRDSGKLALDSEYHGRRFD